jgi:hypothetical protein
MKNQLKTLFKVRNSTSWRIGLKKFFHAFGVILRGLTQDVRRCAEKNESGGFNEITEQQYP